VGEDGVFPSPLNEKTVVSKMGFTSRIGIEITEFSYFHFIING
jgi:hypothetical protein